MDKVNAVRAESPDMPKSTSPTSKAQHFLPEFGRQGSRNPEPDKQHLCSCLDVCQAASFPRADLMFLKSLKTPGSWSHSEKWECRAPTALPTTHPSSARAFCLCHAGPISEETEHPLTSEMRPVLTCLPVSTNLKVIP